jgi:CRISPR/Cas system-associated endoribonuclease Cas2
MSDDGSHTFISEWTASLSRQGARQEGCGIGTEAFRLAQEWLDGQSESRRSIRDADAEILAMYADHREAALRELDKARVSQLAQAKMDHVQACFRADAAEAQLAAMREVLRKLMKEAQGFLALAAIGDHDLTNIRVLQSEIDDAYAALAAPAGRGENGA